MTATTLLCGRPRGKGRIHRKKLGLMTLEVGSTRPTVEPIGEDIFWGVKPGWEWEQQFITCPIHGELTIGRGIMVWVR